MKKASAAGYAMLVAVLALAGFFTFPLLVPSPAHTTTTAAGCVLDGGTTVRTVTLQAQTSQVSPVRSEAHSTSFGAVTEFSLSSPGRWPNSIVAEGRGAWFGESGAPGTAHISENGTLTEFPWPGADNTSGGYKTGIWGIATWGGGVWATDTDRNLLVEVMPSSSSVRVLNVSGLFDSPAGPVAAPDGGLWLVSFSSPSRVARLAADLTLDIFTFRELCGAWPAQLDFVGAGSGYFVGLNPDSPTGGGGLFSFSVSGGSFSAVRTGGGFPLFFPDSVSSSGGLVWVAQHGPSSIVSYNLTSGAWTTWPTSIVNYSAYTLPYYVEADGTSVWFNEHYGNKIGMVDPVAGTLVEFSESNPAATSFLEIQNDLTIARGTGGVWFTSATGNYVGFVNGTTPSAGFDLRPYSPRTVTVDRGGVATFVLKLTGTWDVSLREGFSDSEQASSLPHLISLGENLTEIAPRFEAGLVTYLTFPVVTSPGLAPGSYTLAFTLSDGLVSKTSYVTLIVR